MRPWLTGSQPCSKQDYRDNVTTMTQDQYRHLICQKRLTRKQLYRCIYVDKEKKFKFWKSPASQSGSRNFPKDSSTLRDRAFFHNLAHISGKSDRIFVKILPQMYNFEQGSLRYILEVVRIRNPDKDSGYGPDSPWRRSTLSLQCSCH